MVEQPGQMVGHGEALQLRPDVRVVDGQGCQLRETDGDLEFALGEVLAPAEPVQAENSFELSSCQERNHERVRLIDWSWSPSVPAARRGLGHDPGGGGLGYRPHDSLPVPQGARAYGHSRPCITDKSRTEQAERRLGRVQSERIVEKDLFQCIRNSSEDGVGGTLRHHQVGDVRDDDLAGG